MYSKAIKIKSNYHNRYTLIQSMFTQEEANNCILSADEVLLSHNFYNFTKTISLDKLREGRTDTTGFFTIVKVCNS